MDRIRTRPTVCTGDRFDERNAFPIPAPGVGPELQEAQIGDGHDAMSTPARQPVRQSPALQAGAVAPLRARLFGANLFFRAIDGLLAAMLVVMLVMVLGNVILRYGFGTGITVSEELSRTMFVWITFVGAVVATREGTHLSVDSLVVHLPHRAKVVCAVLSELIVVACCVLIFWGTWRQHEVNATTASLLTGMPLIWIFGVGYVVSLGIGGLGVHKLWRIATGTIAANELFPSPSTETSTQTSTAAPAKGEGAAP